MNATKHIDGPGRPAARARRLLRRALPGLATAALAAASYLLTSTQVATAAHGNWYYGPTSTAGGYYGYTEAQNSASYLVAHFINQTVNQYRLSLCSNSDHTCKRVATTPWAMSSGQSYTSVHCGIANNGHRLNDSGWTVPSCDTAFGNKVVQGTLK